MCILTAANKNNHILSVLLYIYSRAGNSLISFLSESLVFLPKNQRMSDLLKKTSDWLIRSILVSDLSDLLMASHFL